jgi:hypothetical protein
MTSFGSIVLLYTWRMSVYRTQIYYEINKLHAMKFNDAVVILAIKVTIRIICLSNRTRKSLKNSFFACYNRLQPPPPPQPTASWHTKRRKTTKGDWREVAIITILADGERGGNRFPRQQKSYVLTYFFSMIYLSPSVHLGHTKKEGKI